MPSSSILSSNTPSATPAGPRVFEMNLPPTSSAEDVAEFVRMNGYAIVDDLAPDVVEDAERELAPFFQRAPWGTGSFTGDRTQRVARLIARSPACRQLAAHPLVLGTVDRLFEGQCYHAQLALTQAIRVHPGQGSQSLHRDDNVFPFKHPRAPTVLFCMWAISEFEADNGATRLIPGSHLWDDQQTPEESQTLVAGMRPGSVLFWEGATYHGAGASHSSQPRVGALMGYSLGWPRQYENQYLAVPPDVARTLSPQLQQLLGYQSHGYLGSYEGVDPRALLQQPDLELPAPADLLTLDLERLSRQRH